MGGHVEDEEEEAEQSHEIQEGRLENTARREISRRSATWRVAEQALVAIDTAAALAQAKLAVDALQRAFGRNRYILRTLPVRSRVDPSRRLTGKLDDASGWVDARCLHRRVTRARKRSASCSRTAISVGERLDREGTAVVRRGVGALMEERARDRSGGSADGRRSPHVSPRCAKRLRPPPRAKR